MNTFIRMVVYLYILLFIIVETYSQVIPIDSVRKQDSNGVPYLLNQTVTVRGVVTMSGELGNLLVYFQDPTGGLVAYDTAFRSGTTRGDSIQVTGKVTQYSGLTELQPVYSFQILGTNRPVTPFVVTTNIIRVSGEPYEGRLIRINNIIQVKNTYGVPVTQWTVSGSGTNYRIFDGIDSCDIRIYSTTNIANSAIPPYPFSVLALNSQYCQNPPYNTGYQILPRALTDFIITGGGPVLSQITYTNIQQNSVTITWTSSVESDSKVRWLKADSNYQPIIWRDSIYNPSQITNHLLTLNNLLPGRIYYFNVTSSTGSASTTSLNQYFATQSNSSGRINVYFNRSVDTTVKTGEAALGYVNFQTKLKNRIDSAAYSIDMCLYSFDDLTQIRDALINAKIRGVRIRFVYDSRNNQALVNDLISAGIPIQKRNYQTSAIMHNKFFVFDYRDTSQINNVWVWTGSTNITQQQFFTDGNNVIEIQDRTLAAIYTREFEEMWGTHTDLPNPSIAKFGPAKTDNVPHICNINGIRIEPYFSPSDNTVTQVANMILNNLDNDVYFCIYSFTNFTIENAMHSRFNPAQNRFVRGVFDRDTGNSVYKEMKGIGGQIWNPPADVLIDNVEPGILHHKYMIIDSDFPTSNPVTETGSYNWSNAASFDNDENLLIIYSPRISNLYLQEWYKRYRVSGGQFVIGIEKISNVTPQKFVLFQNYPNPFNPTTNIKYEIPKNSFISLKLYNVLGQEVGKLVNENQQAGTYLVTLDAGKLSSGIYFYTLEADGKIITTKKMIIVK